MLHPPSLSPLGLHIVVFCRFLFIFTFTFAVQKEKKKKEFICPTLCVFIAIISSRTSQQPIPNTLPVGEGVVVDLQHIFTRNRFGGVVQ